MNAKEKKWLFEDKEIRSILCDKYGNPYDGHVLLKAVNGQLHVDSLISKVDLTKSDYLQIEAEIKRRGFDCYYIERKIDGQLTLIKKLINQ